MAPDCQACSDQELARQSQQGSLPAFEELVYRYEGRIFGFAVNFCRNAADASEVTQDTFVKAFQAIGRFDCRRDFAPWLFRIARTRCIDHHRRRPPAATEPLPELATEEDPAAELARQDDRRELWARAQRCLPEAQFQALWLRYVEDLDVAGVAQALRKTRTHVKVLLFRARHTLARQLQPGAGKDSYETVVPKAFVG